jgi:hypothetical protein
VTCTGALVHLRDVSNSSSAFLHMHEENVSRSSGLCISSTGKYIAVQQTIQSASNLDRAYTEESSTQQASYRSPSTMIASRVMYAAS